MDSDSNSLEYRDFYICDCFLLISDIYTSESNPHDNIIQDQWFRWKNNCLFKKGNIAICNFFSGISSNIRQIPSNSDPFIDPIHKILKIDIFNLITSK